MSEIRKATNEDIPKMIPILKEFFPVHNIFSDENYSRDYLKETITDFIVMTYLDDVIATLRIVRKKETPQHQLVELKHIATKDKDEEKIIELIYAAEELIEGGKIELHIAESESPNRRFFEKLGYMIEGTLNNHYRRGEKCYILGKYIPE